MRTQHSTDGDEFGELGGEGVKVLAEVVGSKISQANLEIGTTSGAGHQDAQESQIDRQLYDRTPTLVEVQVLACMCCT